MSRLLQIIAVLSLAQVCSAAQHAMPPSREFAQTPGAVVAAVTPLREGRSGVVFQVDEVLRGSFAPGHVILSLDQAPVVYRPALVVFTELAVTRFPDQDRRVAVAPRVVRSFLSGEAYVLDTPAARRLLLQGSEDAHWLMDVLQEASPDLARLAAGELVGRQMLVNLSAAEEDRLTGFVSDARADPLAREMLLQAAMQQPWGLEAARRVLDEHGRGALTLAYGDSLIHTALEVLARYGESADLPRLAPWQQVDHAALAEAAMLAYRRLTAAPRSPDERGRR